MRARPGEEITVEDLEAVVQSVDSDGDGFINYAEFTKVLMDNKSSNQHKGNLTELPS